MVLDRIYEFNLGDTYHKVNKFKKLGNVLTSSKVTMIFFKSGLIDLRKGKDVIIIFLAKKDLGYITYIANHRYGVGDFMFYTNSEVETLNKIWEPKLTQTYYVGSSWRKFNDKDSILNEFIDPLEFAENRVKTAMKDFEFAKRMLVMCENELTETKKRFVWLNKK